MLNKIYYYYFISHVNIYKARPNRGVGLVRNRVDGGMEEHFSSNGEKQAAGLLAFERRGVDHNAEPMVEVFDGSASSTKHSDDKLRAISNKIRNAELGKISIESRSDVDGGSDFRNEEIDQLPGGMLVDGQPSQGENDPVCQAQIQRNGCSQGNTRGLGNNHALSDSNQGDLGVEERDVGGMEIEKH